MQRASKNDFRHKLGTGLTVVGLAVAVMAFGLLRTVIAAWYAGVESAPPDRLITRNAVNISFPLPLSYREHIAKVPGVEKVSYAYWFGAYYLDPKNFFASFAVDHNTYFNLYSEYLLNSAALAAFKSEKTAAVCGQVLADRFGWKVGDRVRLIGTIFPGNWDLHLVGIFHGQKSTTDESAFFLRWDLLDESLRAAAFSRNCNRDQLLFLTDWDESLRPATEPPQPGHVGWYILKISSPADAVRVSKTVDALFKNAPAKTLTETEGAFQLSFAAMSSAIITGLQLVSYLFIGIILLVLANTMAMAARERISEYAILKALGFRPRHLACLIEGESLFISSAGGILGMLLIFPLAGGFARGMKMWFPVFSVKPATLLWAGILSFLAGLSASVFPILKATRLSVVDGLRLAG